MSISDIEFSVTDGSRGNHKRQFRCYVKFVLFGTIVMRDCRILSRTDDDGTESLMLIFPDKMSRKPCPECGAHCTSARDRFCSACGVRVRDKAAVPDRTQIVHPISHEARQWIERVVFAAYREYREDPAGYAADRREAYERAAAPVSRVRQLLRSEA